MVQQEVTAALISVLGSVLLAVGSALASWCYHRSRRKEITLALLKEHPLFSLHLDADMEISCYDPVRGDFFNYIKNYVVILPVQTEFRQLLSTWTEGTLTRDEKDIVCDRLHLCMENIMRLHALRCAEVPRISNIVGRMLKPFGSSTGRAVKDLVRTEYDNATLLTVAVNLVYASLFTIVVEWCVCANMINGQLNNCTWEGQPMRNTFHGTSAALVAHIKHWYGIVRQYLDVHLLVLRDAGTIAWISPELVAALDYRPGHLAGRHWGVVQTSAGDDANAIGALAADVRLKWEGGDSSADDKSLSQAVARGEGFHGVSCIASREGQSIPVCVCMDHITTLVGADGQLEDDGKEWVCSIGALDCAKGGRVWSLAELNTILALFVRLSVGRFDSAVSISEVDSDIVVYRNEACTLEPNINVGVPLHVNLGVARVEVAAAMNRCTQFADSDLLRYSALTYVVQRIPYRCHMYVLGDYALCVHVKCVDASKSKSTKQKKVAARSRSNFDAKPLSTMFGGPEDGGRKVQGEMVVSV